MDQTVINELNHVLSGEQMAIEAYEKFIGEAADPKIKTEFQRIQRQHKEHAARLAERVQTMGGQPKQSTGISGAMANIKLSMDARSKDSLELLKKAYDGEDKGIAMVEEIIKGDLDADSRKLVEDVLSNDHDHLKKMLTLISQYENRMH